MIRSRPEKDSRLVLFIFVDDQRKPLELFTTRALQNASPVIHLGHLICVTAPLKHNHFCPGMQSEVDEKAGVHMFRH
jgi:hypothetical protein